MKWEYETVWAGSTKNMSNKALSVDDWDLIKDLFRSMGNEGWELVSIDNGVAYFKRPIKNRPIPQVSLFYANDYPDEISQEMQEKISKLKLGEYIVFNGWLAKEIGEFTPVEHAEEGFPPVGKTEVIIGSPEWAQEMADLHERRFRDFG